MNNSFADVVRTFLSQNPLLIDSLIEIIYTVADDLDDMKMLSNGEYISPHRLRHDIVVLSLSKIGYNINDLTSLCRQGRGKEILHQINSLSSPSSSIPPSRRALPPN